MVSSDKFLKIIANEPFDDAEELVGGVEYASAPCGSFKTTAAACYIADNIQTSAKNFMYVAQSVRLIDEVAARLSKLGVENIIKIHSETSSNVVKDVMNVLKDPPDMFVVLISHSAFFRIPYFPNRSDWQIFFDENPEIDTFTELELKVSHVFLRDYIQAERISIQLSKITTREGADIDDLLKLPDTAMDGFRELLEHIKSDNYDVYVRTEDYDRVIERATSRDGDAGDWSIPFLSVVKAKVFFNCCFLAANFEHLLIHDHLKKARYNLRPAKALLKRLGYTSYPASIGQRTSIRYCLEKEKFSKSIRKKMTSDGKTVKQAIDETILLLELQSAYSSLLSSYKEG